MTHVAPRDLALLLAINAIWGFNLVASKTGVEHFPPVLFTALRFGLVALVLAPFLRWHPGRMDRLLVAAVLSGGVQYALLFIGLAQVEHVGSVAIATQLGVPFTTLLSVLLLGEVVRWRRRLGIALAFGGVAVIAFEPGVLAERSGLALVIASAFMGSLGLVAVKWLGESLTPFELQAWFAWTGLPVLFFLTFWLEEGHAAALASASPLEWGAVLYTAFVATLVGHTGFYYLMQRYPVTSLSPLTLLSPVFGVAFAMLFFGEPLTPRIVVGGLLTLTGVLIIAIRERKMVDTGT